MECWRNEWIDREHYLPTLIIFSHFIMFSRKNPATSKKLSRVTLLMIPPYRTSKTTAQEGKPGQNRLEGKASMGIRILISPKKKKIRSQS